MAPSRKRIKIVFAIALLVLAPQWATAAQRGSPGRGVSPISAWECPVSYPIKGNFTTYSGERCIYHVPGGQFYQQDKAGEVLCKCG